jgi:hypothetical protein
LRDHVGPAPWVGPWHRRCWLAVSDEAGSTSASGHARARANLNEFLAREQERGSVMPDSLWAAVRAEMAQAFCSPFIVPTTVVANAS